MKKLQEKRLHAYEDEARLKEIQSLFAENYFEFTLKEVEMMMIHEWAANTDVTIEGSNFLIHFDCNNVDSDDTQLRTPTEYIWDMTDVYTDGVPNWDFSDDIDLECITIQKVFNYAKSDKLLVVNEDKGSATVVDLDLEDLSFVIV